MESYFRELATKLFGVLQGEEVLLLNYECEDSDFVRLNHNRIRQAGQVRQQGLRLDLIASGRQLTAGLSLSGNLEHDAAQAQALLHSLRERLPLLPEDPYLHYATEPQDTRKAGDNRLPPPQEAVSQVIEAATGLDLVGIWASGEMAHGFANSLGQSGWQSSYSFNFDWSIYHQGDKATKQNYAGFEWDREFAHQKIERARQDLELLAKPPVTIKPGRYRVFLSPSALNELMELLNWGGFGLKSHRTQQTPLLKMIKEGVNLSSKVSLIENHAAGLAPAFNAAGFIKPDTVTLIADGVYRECLANPRSAKEYDVEVNCGIEHPQSLELAGGELHQDDVMKVLGTGVYISNLWYCNYSDRNHCRITGMTRFACLWVENGKPVAPLGVMRFDESVFNILGENLVDLTEEHEHIFDTNTYGKRSETSSRLPGALVDDFAFTL